MENLYLSAEVIESFRLYLCEEEKSDNTIEKYLRDIRFFSEWLGNRILDKSSALDYKKELCGKYAPASVNSVISSLNTLFVFLNRHDLKIKTLKIQKQIFLSKDRELTKREYEKLLFVAKSKNNRRLYYLMQTIASTGIRISELKFITVEAVKAGQANINCKGKMRRVFLPKQLCRILKDFCKSCNISSGPVFVSNSGRPLSRSNIWKAMKMLCTSAGISPGKVFPHNLRHLFARTYYSLQKDIVRLADILGHSNINTTRIYTMETGEIHLRQIQKLGLLLC